MVLKHNVEFDKYQKRGAYHWDWYATNKFNYRDYAQRALRFIPNPGKLLDIGCGDGLISYLFYTAGFNVTGIEPNRIAIQLGYREIVRRTVKESPLSRFQFLLSGGAKRYLDKKGIRFYQQSIEEISSSQQFKYAICLEVIEHVPYPKVMINKILELVESTAIISTPNGEFNKPSEYDHQFWTPSEFINLLGPKRATLLHIDENRIFAQLDCHK